MESYVYQPENRVSEFAQAVSLLSSKYADLKVAWPDPLTDPTYSATLDIPFDREAKIYCADGWKNRHGRFYSPETF